MGVQHSTKEEAGVATSWPTGQVVDCDVHLDPVVPEGPEDLVAQGVPEGGRSAGCCNSAAAAEDLEEVEEEVVQVDSHHLADLGGLGALEDQGDPEEDHVQEGQEEIQQVVLAEVLGEDCTVDLQADPEVDHRVFPSKIRRKVCHP